MKDFVLPRDVFTEDNLVDLNYPDRLKCLICIDTILDPIECSDCEKIFCKDCMEEYIRKYEYKCVACKNKWNPKKKTH